MSEKKPDGGPAYPVPDLYIPHLEQIAYGHAGQTLRDKFAGDVIGHLIGKTPSITDQKPNETTGEWMARYAYEVADAMLKARNA